MALRAVVASTLFLHFLTHGFKQTLCTNDSHSSLDSNQDALRLDATDASTIASIGAPSTSPSSPSSITSSTPLPPPGTKDEKLGIDVYTKKLFEKYGEDGGMSFEGFEHLLENLHLAQVHFSDHDVHDHRLNNGFRFRPLHDESHDHRRNHSKEDHHSPQSVPHEDDHRHPENKKRDEQSLNGELDGNHHHQTQDRWENEQTLNGKSNGDHHHHTQNSREDEQILNGQSNGDHHHQTQNKRENEQTLNGTSNSDHHYHTQNRREDEQTLNGKSNGDHHLHTQNRREDEQTLNNGTNERGKGRRRGRRRVKESTEVEVEKHRQQFHRPIGSKSEVDAYLTHSLFDEPRAKCLGTTNYWLNGSTNHQAVMTYEIFSIICPSLIYQIDSGACSKPQKKDRFGHLTSLTLHDTSTEAVASNLSFHNWLYATLAITVVSLCGIAGVCIIPAMRNTHFDSVLQFFIALAVGSLSGDALLHLLPHAFASSSSSSAAHSHNKQRETHAEGVGKGLMAVGGLFAFFLIERLVILIKFNGFKGRKGKKSRRSSVTEIFKEESAKEDKAVVVPWCHEEETEQNHIHHHSHARDHKSDHDLAHQHGHGHGHSHGVESGKELEKKSLTSLALMVILGDGIHNFCDGAAIGAAFAASTTVGISTTVAVVCHELPHEIGDFAVLLNTGMSIGKAFFYNIVSSVLSLLGMLLGLLIAGSFEETASWIFAMTAGSFLYISLTDLMPELASGMAAASKATGEPVPRATEADHPSSSSEQTSRLVAPIKIFVLHVGGICLGIIVMAVIGIYEEDLKRVLD